jgi:hypothetical protein
MSQYANVIARLIGRHVMENSLKGLFGGGEEGAAKTDRARDFVKRFSEGNPSEGYSQEEAAERLNDVLAHANSDQVKRATRAALNNLPEDQQQEFGKFVSELKARKSGGDAGAAGGSFSMDDIADMFGQSGGSANSLDDLLGGLLGGGGTTGAASGGGGLGGMLSGMLGGLLGGGDKSNSGATASGDDGFNIGDLLSGPTGKLIMGGIAAYLTKEMLDGKG